MDFNTLRLSVYQMNEDEKFYKKAFLARLYQNGMDEFIDSLDMEYVLRRHLLIPEVPETIPSVFEDSFFMPDDKNELLVLRHNRYSPAIPHYHDFFEILYIYDGNCFQNISGVSYKMHTGDMCFIPPNTAHRVEVYDDNSVILNVLVRKETLHEIFHTFLNTDNIISSFFMQNLYSATSGDFLIFHTGMDVGIQDSFMRMFFESENKELYYENAISNTLSIIFTLLIRHYSSCAEFSALNSPDKNRCLMLLNYIQNHYTTVNLETIARQFHYSQKYASKLIKEITGKNFTEILHQTKIEKSKDLLVHTALPISVIGETVGYSTSESFMRLFKKYTGLTPTVFRRKYSK